MSADALVSDEALAEIRLAYTSHADMQVLLRELDRLKAHNDYLTEMFYGVASLKLCDRHNAIPIVERVRSRITGSWCQDCLADENAQLRAVSAVDRPRISVSPDMRGGTPVISGHRLGAVALADRYWHIGEAYQFEILDAFELTRSELLIACWYTATYGSRTYRKRWKDWAQGILSETGLGRGPDAQPSGWWGDLDEIDLPPHKRSEPPLPRAGATPR